MRSFPDLGHWTLRRLSDCFELEKEDVGSDAHLKKRGIALDTESYRIGGVGHFCILRMNALFGLMKMETAVLAPTEKDLPLLNLDRVRFLKKDAQFAELYDTQLSPWSRETAAVFESLKDRDRDLPEPAKKTAHWYDNLLYPCSYRKAGIGISDRLTETGQDYAEAFIAALASAPSCNPTAKKEKVVQFADTLFTQGGPAVDTVTKLFGKETARRLILRYMYGT